MAAERIVAVGLAMPFPAMSGGDPCDAARGAVVQRRIRGMEQIDGAQPAIEVEPLTQVELRGHLDAGRPAHPGKSHGAKQDGVELAQSLEHGRRQGVAAAQVFMRPHGHLLILQSQARASLHGVEYADRFRHHLRPDTVSRQQGDAEGLHAPVTSLSLPKNCRLRSVLIPQLTGGH